jgi:hypothetical protein
MLLNWDIRELLFGKGVVGVVRKGRYRYRHIYNYNQAITKIYIRK